MKRCQDFYISSCCWPVLLLFLIFLLFYPKDCKFLFFSYWARSRLIYKTIHWHVVSLCNGLLISLEMFKHTLCLCTVLCILSNWQKKNWELNFQFDNVIVLKENLFFDMRYHVKWLMLGISPLLKLNVTKLIMLQGAGMIRKTYRSQIQCGMCHISCTFWLCVHSKLCL